MRQVPAVPALSCATVAATLMMTTATMAAPPQVVADSPVVGSMVQQVMGDLGEVRVLLPGGTSVHDYQMRPSDTAALQDAGLLVWVGPELTPWLGRAASTVASGASLPLLAVAGTHHREFTEAHDHGDEHGHDDAHGRHDAHKHEQENGHEHDHHEHGALDPHAWLDPDNGKLWLTEIAGQLAKIDPENAATYSSNAKAGVERIDQTAAAIRELLATAKGAKFIVFHDAYGYFTESFDLEPAIAVSLGDASTPSAARLSAIRDQIGSAEISCAFPEAGHDPALIAAVVDASDARIGGILDPEGTALSAGPALYPDLLLRLGETIATCIGSTE